MIGKKSSIALILCVAAVAVVFAGCGSSNSATTASNTASKTASNAGATQSSGAMVPAGTVSTASTSLGTVLVGEGGKTLYLFEADKNGKSSCSGDCASDWPPAMAGSSAKVSGDAQMSMLTTVSRSGGGKQLVYNGHPLYFFAGDKAAGDVNGNGIDGHGAKWFAMTSAGKSVGDSGNSSDSSSSSSSSSGGY